MGVRLRFIVLAVVINLGVLLLLPQTGAAWTAANLTVVTQDNDRFCSYDFEASTAATAETCDWPVTIVFWGNASVAKVKQALSSTLPISGNEMYGYLSPDRGARGIRHKRPPIGMEWIADRGVKSFSLSRALHLRLYADADGHLTNSIWGNYVVGTTHLDISELSTNPVYGYSEQAAAEIEALCVSAFGVGSVVPDAFDLHNPEPDRSEQRPNTKGGLDTHFWQCDGLASTVYVP